MGFFFLGLTLGLTLQKIEKISLILQRPSTWCSFIFWVSISNVSAQCTRRQPTSAGPPPPARFAPRGVTGKVSFSKDATTKWWYIYGFRDRAGTRGGLLESPSFPGLPHRTTNGEREDPRKVGEGCRRFFSYAILLVLLHP